MGALLVASGKPEDAVVPLEFAVGKSPTPANQLALAQAYSSTKQPAKAEPLAARAGCPQLLATSSCGCSMGACCATNRKVPAAADDSNRRAAVTGFGLRPGQNLRASW